MPSAKQMAKRRISQLRAEIDAELEKIHWQKPHVEFDDGKKREYLAALARLGTHEAAADWVGVNVRTAYAHRKGPAKDPGFEEECVVQMDRFNRIRLEGSAIARGVDGVDEPIYQGGKLVGWKRAYSDRLLEQMLRARLPEYREQVDLAHSGEVGLTSGVLVIPGIAPKPSSPEDKQ